MNHDIIENKLKIFTNFVGVDIKLKHHIQEGSAIQRTKNILGTAHNYWTKGQGREVIDNIGKKGKNLLKGSMTVPRRASAQRGFIGAELPRTGSTRGGNPRVEQFVTNKRVGNPRLGNPYQVGSTRERVEKLAKDKQDFDNRMKKAMPAENDKPAYGFTPKAPATGVKSPGIGPGESSEGLLSKATGHISKFAKEHGDHVAMGTAGATGALAAGIAAKRYLSRKKK